MPRPEVVGKWIAWAVVTAMLCGLLSGCSAGAPAASAPSQELAALQQQVAGQAARIAALETQAAQPQPAAVQETRIAVLETRVALPQPTAGAATAAPVTPQPTPTMVPAIAGLAVDGATKGPATAKVTITEYTDYL